MGRIIFRKLLRVGPERRDMGLEHDLNMVTLIYDQPLNNEEIITQNQHVLIEMITRQHLPPIVTLGIQFVTQVTKLMK